MVLRRPPVPPGQDGTGRTPVLEAPDRHRQPTARPGSHRTGGHRLDIQGLRAVAVGLVVLYHLRPDLLPGGFIGVDVFFVISGFLIVGSLGREAAATGTIRLREFYAKRIRRLLPASTVVLLATMAATVALMPMSRWTGTAQDVLASALQVQNWALALSDGYAAATDAVSPLQHFWSLAVEEQFYLFTPLFLLGAVWVAARLARPPMAVITGAMLLLALASLVHSVLLSASDSQAAYFVTTTRVWELAAGGLLALAGARAHLPAVLRPLAVTGGLLVLTACAVVYTTSMAFPGWVAVVPIAATLLVLAGGSPAGDGDPRPSLPGRLLGSRVPRYVGDVSYSLYLWHWPVVVFFVFLVQRTPTVQDCVVLLGLSLGLAALSTRFVEEPFRRPRPAPAREGAAAGPARRPSTRTAYRLAAVLLTLSIAAAAGPWAYVQQRLAGLSSPALDADHPGGATALPEQLPPAGDVPVVPDPVVAIDDGPVVYDSDCGQFDPRTMDADACVYGEVGSSATVALVGDSHAAQWSTVLADVSSAQGWQLQTMVRNGCPFTLATARAGDSSDTDCPAANALTAQRIVDVAPRLVVVSAMTPAGYEAELDWRWDSLQAQVDGYRAAWAPVLEAGIPIVVLRDTPLPPFSAPECVEQYGADSAECHVSREDGHDGNADPLLLAAEGTPGVTVVDLTDHLCNSQVCPSVVGNVLVYRDNHLTDTFTRSLAPRLSEELVGLV